MKKTAKKLLFFVLVCALTLTSIIALTACKNNNGGNSGGGNGGNNNTTTESGLPSILADLIDYGSESKYYNVQKKDYSASAQENAVEDLISKQNEQKDKFDPQRTGEYTWEDDTTTFTKIFCYADMETLVEKFAIAGLEESRMQKLVAYISRDDIKRGKGEYGLQKGETGAIQDYEELDELYDLYDNKSEDNTIYDNLQLKKRKVMYELDYIFGDKADQAARVATEVLAYSEQVVNEDMMDGYTPVDTEIDAFWDYMKEEMFDYDTLVYFLAFNETTDYVYESGSYTIGNRKDITTLYGYYYQYERADYYVFPDEDLKDTDYKAYLALSHKDYFENDADAKKYNEYQRREYVGSYRYSDSFYTKYYKAHFAFQMKQENYDREVFTGGSGDRYADGIGYANSTKVTYSSEMLEGLSVGLASTLKISDADYVYSGDEANVIAMNNANTGWNSLTESQQGNAKNKIYKVLMERQELISQKFSMYYVCATDASRSVLTTDLTKALKYEIKSYSGDYVRNIQSYKKNDVIMNKELERLNAKGADQEEIDAKEEEIGRNLAMLKNLETNYGEADIAGQMKTAENEQWDNIKTELENSINPEADGEAYYKNYHESHQKGSDTVDKYFENKLIVKTYSCGGDAENCEKGNSHAGCATEYDQDHALSRLLYNHEGVVRYMSGQVQVTYKEAKYSDYTLDNIYLSTQYTEGTFDMDNDNDGICEYSGGSGVHASLATVRRYASGDGLKQEDLDTDKAPTLATINTDNKWTDIYIKGDMSGNDQLAYHKETKKEGSNTYDYYFEFAGWYIDEDLKWVALPGETYDFDIALYPAFYITKVQK